MPIYKMNGTKDGKQKYRVRINYTDAFGKPRQTDRTVYGSTEAKELERKLAGQIRDERSFGTNRMTLSDLYEEYKKSQKNELRESTFHKNCSVLENYVINKLGTVPLSKLTAPVIQNWKNTIDEVSIPKTAINSTGRLSLTMKRNIFSVFRALLNWGIKIDYLSHNILVKVGNFKSSEISECKIDFYTADEYTAFSTAAYNNALESNNLLAWDYFVFFSIAFYTGLRKGEIHALKWSDIEDDKYIKVSRSITQKLKGGDRETQPKNKSSIRTLQLPSPLIQILKEHKQRYLQSFSENLYICGGKTPLRDTSIQNMNKKFATQAGIKTIRIHDFRHSHVSLLANSGINIQEIARRLGHSNIEITWNTYSHLYPREEERAISILNNVKITQI